MLVVFTAFLFLSPLCGTNQVCYGKYGCFNKDSPFENPLVRLPQSPSLVNTSFNLYTRTNRKNAVGFDDNTKQQLENSRFDISKRTIFIVHGFKESASSNWLLRMKDALLDREDCNVIPVDWSGGSRTKRGQATGNTRLVGAQIAELIRFLISSNSGSSKWAERFYIVGFSLGAQVAGYAGRHLRGKGMVLGRITGLDPTGPFFVSKNPELHLDRSDAQYVDIIHTDAGFAGTPQLVGHIDFFPNGGCDQPGCSRLKHNLTAYLHCDHKRAPEYYIASVENKCSWTAYPCSDCTRCNGACPLMGYDADGGKKTGVYYLRTNAEPPFCGLKEWPVRRERIRKAFLIHQQFEINLR